jgi:hypothetical protein
MDAPLAGFAEALQAANINPHTGLATDYLNHFNEVVMLMDLLPSMPELRDEILAWQPADYKTHFQQTGFREKDLAMEAYDLAPACYRRPFDEIISVLTGQIIDVQDLLRQDACAPHDWRIGSVGEDIRLSISRASAIVNGGAVYEIETEATQDEIDSLFS